MLKGQLCFPLHRGHGTYMEKGVQVASVAGYVTRVNRLITVTPLRQVYQGVQHGVHLSLILYLIED